MFKKHKSKNGLTVLSSHMPGMASVSLGIWIGVGGRCEAPEKSGISHLIEHMLFKGTYTRSTKELKETIEGVGGAFNGFTSDEVTCYMVKVPAEYMELGIDILSDMVIDPRFDNDDITREKFVVCEEIKMYKDQPADRVLDMLGSIMWPDNPLGRPLTGTITTVKSFNRDKLLSFKEKYYHPGNMAVIAAGNVNTEKLISCIDSRFSALKKKQKKTFAPAVVDNKGPRVKFSGGKTNQTHIALGFPVKDLSVRERFSAKLMNVIFGGNMSSRLFEQLREKNGLCYDIASSYKRHSDIGEFHIHAGVDNKKVMKSVISILDEIKKLKSLGVSEDELKRAKKYVEGQFLLAMEGTSSRMLWMGDRFMVHNDIPEIKDVMKRVEKVTAADIKKIAWKIFKPSLLNLAIVGDVKESVKKYIREEIEKI